MSEQKYTASGEPIGCAQTPLMDLVRRVPKDLRAEWPIQWFDDGTPNGHAMAPIGRYVHDLADTVERLTGALEAIKANSAPDAISLSPKNRTRAFHKIASDALKDEEC